jgi:hypothetical protein
MALVRDIQRAIRKEAIIAGAVFAIGAVPVALVVMSLWNKYVQPRAGCSCGTGQAFAVGGKTSIIDPIFTKGSRSIIDPIFATGSRSIIPPSGWGPIGKFGTGMPMAMFR